MTPLYLFVYYSSFFLSFSMVSSFLFSDKLLNYSPPKSSIFPSPHGTTRNAFPSDRPSPIFSITAQCMNSGIVIVGFQVVLSSDCNYDNVQALALGNMNAMMNMIFAVVIIVLTRRKMARGISRSVSAFRLFLLDPFVVLFLLFVLWEISFILWLTSVPQDDVCTSSVYTQVILLSMSLMLGVMLFILTFATEGCRLPRWRVLAHAKWEELHSQWELGVLNRDPAPSEEQISEEEPVGDQTWSVRESSMRTRSASGSTSQVRQGVVGSTFDRSNSMGSPSASWVCFFFFLRVRMWVVQSLPRFPLMVLLMNIIIFPSFSFSVVVGRLFLCVCVLYYLYSDFYSIQCISPRFFFLQTTLTMSSVLFVEPMRFFANKKAARNPFCRPMKDVSATTESMDTGKVCTLLVELGEKLEKRGVASRKVVLSAEKKGEAVLAGHTMSVHNFTDDQGNIVRRLVVLYPVSPFRQEELAKKQVDQPLSADESEVEIVDLRGFQKSNQFLEGTASVVFSADGRFVYMARSARSSEAVLDVLCSEENLNIPKENRFVFDAAVPTKDGDVPVEFTNVLGWCGNGICAWCLDFIRFDDPEEQERFYSHLEQEYEVVVELTPEETLAFAGTAFEVTSPNGDSALFLPETAKKALSLNSNKAIKKWYGNSIVPVYSEVLERRCGTGVPSVMVLSQTHGPRVPAANQKSTLAVLGIPTPLDYSSMAPFVPVSVSSICCTGMRNGELSIFISCNFYSILYIFRRIYFHNSDDVSLSLIFISFDCIAFTSHLAPVVTCVTRTVVFLIIIPLFHLTEEGVGVMFGRFSCLSHKQKTNQVAAGYTATIQYYYYYYRTKNAVIRDPGVTLHARDKK
eukprot:gene4359-3170_t